MNQDEMTVLASLIAKETSKAAKRSVKAVKVDIENLISTTDGRDTLLALQMHGPEIFEGYLCGRQIEELATPYIDEPLKRLAAEYRQRLAETDRTLDQFETPGPDSEDPECLFQNRWLRRGMCGAVVSTSGVGKSSFSIQAATVWAAGQECLGIRPLRPLKVGIFQAEDDEYDVANFRDRIRIGLTLEMEWTPEQIQAAESRVTFCALDGSTGERFVEHLRRKQEQHHFDLIIINPLFAFFGGDTNDGNAMTAFLRHGIDPLIKADETKCGCIIIHHTGKPNKEALSQGDVFKAYLGSGSSEFTNYIRSAIVLTPYDGGNIPGVFEMIAAKHGDKLAWRDGEGMPTIKKVVCYANRLPEYADKGMIFWIEPDEVQFAEIKKSAAAASAANANRVPPIERCAKVISDLIRTEWTPEGRPANAGNDGQRRWAEKSKQVKTATKCSQSTNRAAYNLIASDPYRFGLMEYRYGRSSYLISAGPAYEISTEEMPF